MDEALCAEIRDREDLVEARRVMGALNYEISDVLRRLARTAPRRLTFLERMKAKRAAILAEIRASSAT